MPLLIGGITLFAGEISAIPAGWQLCDGTNGTPDLRNKFIIGAGNLYEVGATGGFKDQDVIQHSHSGSTSTIPNHQHSVFTSSGTTGTNGYMGADGFRDSGVSLGSAGSHSHSVTVNDVTGEDGTNKNLPPYFALSYIQQIS